MTGYITLYLICIILSLSHIGLFSKRYTEKLAPYLWNDKTNWNPNIDRLKLLLSLTLLIFPIMLLKSFFKYNSNNIYFNYTGFSLLIILLIFCFWLDLKKINSIKKITFFSKKIETEEDFSTQKIDLIKKDLYKLNIKHNKLEEISTNTICKINSNYEEMLNFNNKTLKNVSDISLDIVKIKQENKKDKSNLTHSFKEISKIKEKLKPKKRVSDIRDERINKIKSEFKILVNDLQNFEHYENKKRVLINNFYGIKELEIYQILVIFFQRYYNISEHQTRNIIYDLFNNHFSISLDNGINSGNWSDFKKKILNDIENQTFYSDLILNYNKIHSTVE
jgi:hypothetical protein